MTQLREYYGLFPDRDFLRRVSGVNEWIQGTTRNGMTKSEKEIRRVEEEARRREAAARPFPWWTKGELLGRNDLIAKRLQALAGQEAVILFGKDADPLYPLGAGTARAKVSLSPPANGWAWATIGEVYHGFRLDKVLSVFTPEEAMACEVLP